MGTEVVPPPLWMDLVGHLGYIFLAVGMVLLAKKSILGWISRGIGEAIWLGLGVILSMSSIWMWGIVFCSLEVYGFCSWRKARKSNPEAQ